MSELRIYEIPVMLRKAFDAVTVDEETGELIGFEAVDELQVSAREKVANTARYIRECEAQLSAMKEARENIYQREQSLKKRVEWLKQNAFRALDALGEKIEEADIRVSIRNNAPSGCVVDEELIPADYIVKKVEEVLDKKALLAALKSGQEIAGVELVRTRSLSIK